MDESRMIAEGIALIAEDLRDGRRTLGITVRKAAKRTGKTVEEYRNIERGKVAKDREGMGTMMAVAREVGLESVRTGYLTELGTYFRRELTKGRSIRLFSDQVSSNVSDLSALGHFIGPHIVFRLVEQIGLESVLEARNPVDQIISELWATAVLALSLDSAKGEYYVRPVRDNAPDTELLIADLETERVKVFKVEVTHYGRHSNDLFEIIGKKLAKRYGYAEI